MMAAQLTGKAPKNCYVRADSPNWQYEFVLNGERHRGSTGTSSSREAAQFVEGLKTDLRRDNTSKASK